MMSIENDVESWKWDRYQDKLREKEKERTGQVKKASSQVSSPALILWDAYVYFHLLSNLSYLAAMVFHIYFMSVEFLSVKCVKLNTRLGWLWSKADFIVIIAEVSIFTMVPVSKFPVRQRKWEKMILLNLTCCTATVFGFIIYKKIRYENEKKIGI